MSRTRSVLVLLGVLALVVLGVQINGSSQGFGPSAPSGRPDTAGPRSAPAIAHASNPFTADVFQLANTPGLTTFPGGCVVLPSTKVTACVPAVAADGKRVEDGLVLEKLLGLATQPVSTQGHLENPTVADTSAHLRSPALIHQAVASALLDELLYGYAVAHGRAVSLADARAFAQSEVAAFNADPAAAAAAGFLPTGMSATDYFSSPVVVARAQRMMTISQEVNALTSSGSAPANWLKQEMAHHRVTVDGLAPTFDVAGALAR